MSTRRYLLGAVQFGGKLESLNTLKTNEIAEKALANNVVSFGLALSITQIQKFSVFSPLSDLSDSMVWQRYFGKFRLPDKENRKLN